MLGAVLLTIAALGDSVTVGPPLKTPPRARRTRRAAVAQPAFVAILGKQLGEPDINAGKAGDTSAGMLARLSSAVLLKRPRVVLIMAGLNDAAWVDPGPIPRTAPRVSEAEFERNLTEIVARVKQAKAKAVLLTPNPMTRAYKYQDMPFYQANDINDGVAPYADIVRRVARETGACLVDIFGDWESRREHRDWIPDGLHPNAAGHREIAAKVMSACGDVLKKGSNN